MSDQSRYDRGKAILVDTYGQSIADQALRKLHALSPALERHIVEFVYGDMAAESVLDRKTRILCNIAALTVLGRPEQLRIHIQGAMRAGATEEEIRDTILQMAVFGGFPAAWDGLAVAQTLWNEEA